MSNRTRNLHAWKTRTADGTKREVRAQLFGAKWSLTSLRADGQEWIAHSPPLLEDLEDLEEVLFNKYQRKHVAWEHLVSVRKLIALRTPRD